MRRRIGALALAAKTTGEPARRAAIAARLPVQEWPGRVVLLPAVDAESGEPVIFTRDSGVTPPSAPTRCHPPPADRPRAPDATSARPGQRISPCSGISAASS
jgi:hypothetical protein